MIMRPFFLRRQSRVQLESLTSLHGVISSGRSICLFPLACMKPLETRMKNAGCAESNRDEVVEWMTDGQRSIVGRREDMSHKQSTAH